MARRDAKSEVCKWVRLARERQQRDLKTAKKRGLWFDEAAADRAVQFFGFLRHYKGEWAGKPFVLDAWQRDDIIRPLFGWKRENGTRRFRMAYISEARKNGKTTLAAGVGAYLFMADGEPGAEVYAAATKRDQALICHGDAEHMLKASPQLRSRVTFFRHSLSVPSKAQRFLPLGQDADTLDGLNVHGAIIDELHRHKTRDLLSVLQTGTGARRQPLILAITTAGNNKHSPCYAEEEYAKKVLEGLIEDDQYFGYICSLDEGDDWTDERNWKKANPGLGIAIKLDDLRAECIKAQNQPAYENDFKRFRLNQWTEQADRWISVEQWEANKAKVKPEALAGQVCFGGLDLSAKIDLSALVLDFPKEDGSHDWLCWFWMPEEVVRERSQKDRVPYDRWVKQGFITATPGNIIDQDFIEAEVIRLKDKYDIREIAFDRWNATSIQVHLADEGLTMVEFGQGFASMSEPSKSFEALVVDKKINHGHNPVLTWMVSNVAVKKDPAGNLKPDKASSGSRIDGVVAGIMALGRAMVHPGPAKSIYEERDLRTL